MPHLKKVFSTQRDFRTLDAQSFTHDLDEALSTVPDSVIHVDDLVDYYSYSCTTLLDQAAPFKTRSRSTRCKLPWFDNEIRDARRVRIGDLKGNGENPSPRMIVRITSNNSILLMT